MKCKVMHKRLTTIGVGISLALLVIVLLVNALPVGPTLKSNSTDSYTPKDPLMRNDSKGTVTTLDLNVTQQSYNWKAYVGNVSGRLSLQDSQNYTIYDWTYTEGEGEVYATRASSVTWSSVICANSTVVQTEDSNLNHASTNPDTINSTFKNNTHSAFYVGDVGFSTNECSYTAYTYVNSSASNHFQEILLYDNDKNNLIYATLIENRTSGYNNQNYDFQMLVSEDSTASGNTAYYFYVELS